MAAMMNAHGGNILLGVDDAGGLVGVSLSHHKRDALVLKLNLLVRKHMGNYPATLVVIDAEIIEGLEIIRIECEPSAVPVFVTDNDKEELLIRVSRENTQLRTLRDSIQYFEKRFVTHTMTHTNISFVPPDFTNPQSPDSVS
jgi:predicted HTH transcriptional regulator